jgi:hypothetical protein
VTDVLYSEVRREGKVVAVFRGVPADSGITVETRVFPVNTRDGECIDRPFPFPSAEHAQAFVDESLAALEYLGCTVV